MGYMARVRPRLMFVDAHEDDCNGSAMQIELHPATIDFQGSIMMEFAKQSETSYCDEYGYHSPSFDWANSLKFRLNMTEIAEIIAFLDGGVNYIRDITVHRKNDDVGLFMKHLLIGDVEPIKDSRVVEVSAFVGDRLGGRYKMTKLDIIILSNALKGAMCKLAWGEQQID